MSTERDEEVGGKATVQSLVLEPSSYEESADK